MKVTPIAIAFSLGDGIRVERTTSDKEPLKWAVRDRFQHALSCDGTWEYEPQPSSRDDEFLARCRFDTPVEAIGAYERYLQRSDAEEHERKQS